MDISYNFASDMADFDRKVAIYTYLKERKMFPCAY
jgi:hypothetical protein